MNYTVKLGVVGTRRNLFSREDALKYKQIILDKLKAMEVDFVDIEDINEEGLLYDDNDVEAVGEKLKANKVGALFFPHCNFGTEHLVAEVSKRFELPII